MNETDSIGGGDTPANRLRVEKQIRLGQEEEERIKKEVNEILRKRAAERDYERRSGCSR